MNLVGYSDSEGSDADALPATKSSAKPNTKATSQLFNPATNKVKVNLSSLTSGGKNAEEQEARPAKRQRTGGGLDINAFLPAPKQPAKQTGDTTTRSARGAGKGLGRGVNLKTGAEPAFTRSSVGSLNIDEEPKDIKDVIAELRKSRMPNATLDDELPQPVEEFKPTGSAMRFKPLSVSRNLQKKKKISPSTAAIPATSTRTITPRPSASSIQAQPGNAAPAKPKVSLFSLNQVEEVPSETMCMNGYEPMMDVDSESAELPDEVFDDHRQQTSADTQTPSRTAQGVEGFNMSEADMRKLFGRKAGKNGPDLSNIKMVNFNTEAEYAANEEIRAKGESATFNPVRAIAPGKHSLKQLVNAAQTQKDALEEHFAMGKANQRETGARYGW